MKKIVAVLLVVMLLSGTNSFGAMFSDIEGHWGKEYIEALAMDGVISGMGDGNFAPDDYVTREQFLKMLMVVSSSNADERLSFETPPELNLIVEKSPFSDVSTDRWSYYYIKEAFGRILLAEEYGDRFEPVKDITREEAAVWIARALELSEGECAFTDNNLIGKPGLVGAVYSAGLITGFPDGSFAPGAGLTRAQAAVMLKRTRDYRAKAIYDALPDEIKAVSKDLNLDGAEDTISVKSDGEAYAIKVNDLYIVGGFSTAEESRYYLIDIDKTDSYAEFAVAESFYGSGALAIYRYTGSGLYMAGYITTVGTVSLRTDNTPIGDEWGAMCINSDGTITANVGEQFVHTILVRKQFALNDKNRLAPVSGEFYTIGNYSEFVVTRDLYSSGNNDSKPAITLKEGYAGKIVKTDLKNWIYIETGSGDSGWVYIQNDGLISGEPISYYLEGLHYAG